MHVLACMWSWVYVDIIVQYRYWIIYAPFKVKYLLRKIPTQIPSLGSTLESNVHLLYWDAHHWLVSVPLSNFGIWYDVQAVISWKWLTWLKKIRIQPYMVSQKTINFILSLFTQFSSKFRDETWIEPIFNSSKGILTCSASLYKDSVYSFLSRSLSACHNILYINLESKDTRLSRKE